MEEQGLREAWQEAIHADIFDARAQFSLGLLRRVYETFNEFRLFLDYKKEIGGREFSRDRVRHGRAVSILTALSSRI